MKRLKLGCMLVSAGEFGNTNEVKGRQMFSSTKKKKRNMLPRTSFCYPVTVLLTVDCLELTAEDKVNPVNIKPKNSTSNWVKLEHPGVVTLCLCVYIHSYIDITVKWLHEYFAAVRFIFYCYYCLQTVNFKVLTFFVVSVNICLSVLLSYPISNKTCDLLCDKC